MLGRGAGERGGLAQRGQLVAVALEVAHGLRAGGDMRLTQEATLFGSMSFEWRNYHGPDPLFLTTRKDTQADLSVGIVYVPIRKWTITPSLSYTRNRSNIIISDYDRVVFSVSVRRDFN